MSEIATGELLRRIDDCCSNRGIRSGCGCPICLAAVMIIVERVRITLTKAETRIG